jgi:hypothetical protein
MPKVDIEQAGVLAHHKVVSTCHRCVIHALHMVTVTVPVSVPPLPSLRSRKVSMAVSPEARNQAAIGVVVNTSTVGFQSGNATGAEYCRLWQPCGYRHYRDRYRYQ